MPKILIAEDNNDINNMILRYLKGEGFECVQAFSGTEVLLYIQNSAFDIIILDLMLPGMSGEELLQKIKPDITTPIIVLSAKDGLDSKVNTLLWGADDYMTKPFELEELLARITVQLRKSSHNAQSSDTLQYKQLCLNKQNHTVTINRMELSFTKQEFKILELLLTNPERVFSKQEIYDYAWEYFYIGENKTVNVHISNIRKKLKAVTDEEYIDTVWGIGFRLAK